MWKLMLAGLGAGAAFTLFTRRASANPSSLPPSASPSPIKPVQFKIGSKVDANQGGTIVTLEIPDESEWVELEHEGKRYLVAPRAIGPFRIGEAVKLAAMKGWVVPTRALSDAIWQAADLKVMPRPMAHDGTPKTMFSQDTIARHKAFVEKQIDGRDFKLLSGDHKDIVVEHGKAGIYGWHVAEGDALKLGIPTYTPVTKGLGARIVQPWPSPHDDAWGDYSQYLHPVKEL